MDHSTLPFYPQGISTLTFIRDTFLIDFYEKFTQNSQLIGQEDLNRYIKYFANKRVTPDVSMIPNPNPSGSPLFEGFNVMLQNEHPKILNILELGKGKISLCGIEILCMYPRDLYFHSCTIEEANTLLIESIKILGEQASYWLVDNKLCFKMGRDIGSFSFNIYKDKESLLRNIGPSPDRHGWNPIDGYFGTLSSGIMIAMNVYPLDIDFKDNKLLEFDTFGLDIIFHGLQYIPRLGDIIRIRGEDYIQYNEDSHMEFHICDRKSSRNESTRYGELMISSKPFELFNSKFVKATDPSTWYKQGYIPYTVGISNNRYVAFANIMRFYNIPKEMSDILCLCWLAAEVHDVREKLLALNY